MNNVKRIEASAATQAATGITHYEIADPNSWKALGANGAEIAAIVGPKEAGGKFGLRIHTRDRVAEITYSIEQDKNKFVIAAVVNGVPAKVAFATDGGLVEGGVSKMLDPATNEMFRSIASDWMALRDAPRRSGHDRISKLECRALGDVIDGAARAHEWLSYIVLTEQWVFAGCAGYVLP